jgi:hypothetical protein
MHARCPSLAYWLRATAMVPITLAALFAVRCAPACLPAGHAFHPLDEVPCLPLVLRWHVFLCILTYLTSPNVASCPPACLPSSPGLQGVSAAQGRRAAGSWLPARGGRGGVDPRLHPDLPSAVLPGRPVRRRVWRGRRHHQGKQLLLLLLVAPLPSCAAGLLPAPPCLAQQYSSPAPSCPAACPLARTCHPDFDCLPPACPPCRAP